jgi:hypothetical protein
MDVAHALACWGELQFARQPIKPHWISDVRGRSLENVPPGMVARTVPVVAAAEIGALAKQFPSAVRCDFGEMISGIIGSY